MTNIEKIKCVGPTAMIKAFKPEFKSEEIAGKVAASRGVSVDEILQEWKVKGEQAIERGNVFHKFIDNDIKFIPNNEVPQTYQMLTNQFLMFKEEIANDYTIINTEFKVYNDDYRIFGIVDAKAINTKTQGKALFEWKTRNAFSTKNGFNESFTGILSHLDLNDLVEASLQLHIYKKLLALAGESILELFVVSFFNSEYRKFTALDLSHEADLLLNERYKQVEEYKKSLSK